jgi:hypothetical protein
MNLLEESFPGITTNIAHCEALGFPWNSKTFLKKERDTILAHAALMQYPMLIDGRWHKAGALHAICTKASHRGQGLVSELIQEALRWAASEYEFVILFTEIPKFYERLSFQYVPEHRFHLTCHHPKGSQSLRPITTPKDDAFFHHCFQKRTPLSKHVWVQDNGNIASFNTLFATYPTFWSLYYSASIDGLISYFLEDKTLHLLDIIAATIPSLDAILDHLPTDIEEIYFYFPPDRLTDAAIAQPYVYDKGHFLVHGPWQGIQPFMIAPLSRC